MLKFNSIQSLRGFAASSVMLYHMDKTLFPYGWAGVDLFFLISGFVMAKIELRQSPARFILKRLIRIVPLYWLTTLAMFFLINYLHMFGGRAHPIQDLIDSLLFIPYATPGGDIWPIVVPGWTLNFEMFFYVVIAISLFFPGTLWVTFAVLATLVVVGALIQPTGPVWSTWTSPLLFEFGAGALVARIRGAIAPRWAVAAIGLSLCQLLVMLGPVGFDATTAWGRVIVFGAASLLLLIGCLHLENGVPQLFSFRPLVRLGDISYSLYLLHSFAFALTAKLLGVSAWASLAGLAIALGVAYLSWALVERRLGKWLRTKLFGWEAPTSQGG